LLYNITKRKKMKKVFVLIGLAVATLAGTAQTATLTPDGAAEIKWDSKEIDYGTIKQDEDGNREFKLKNTGKVPLVITSCQGSCGCTVPTCPTEPVMPGKTASIKVKYDTHRIGAFTKNVTVVSNATNNSEVLTIKGTVLDPSGAPAATPAKPAGPVTHSGPNDAAEDHSGHNHAVAPATKVDNTKAVAATPAAPAKTKAKKTVKKAAAATPAATSGTK
jgi:hypothetical protein